MPAFKFNNGESVKDIVHTGYEGVIIGRCDHLTGCNTYLIQPK